MNGWNVEAVIPEFKYNWTKIMDMISWSLGDLFFKNKLVSEVGAVEHITKNVFCGI